MKQRIYCGAVILLAGLGILIGSRMTQKQGWISLAEGMGIEEVEPVEPTDPTEPEETPDSEHIRLEDCQITLGKTTYVYTGKACVPKIQVSCGETLLEENNDYVLKYSDNIQVGKAKITVTGIGRCEGQKVLHFTIAKFGTVSEIKASPSYNQTKLSWKKVEGAGGYEIYRKVSGGNYQKIATIKKGGTVSYTDKKVTLGKSYTYKMRAYRSISGKTHYSSWSKTCTQKAQVATPTLTVKSASYQSLTLSWKKVSGASGYVIYRRDASKGSYKKIATISSGNTVSYTDQKKTFQKKYEYKITAFRKVKGKAYYGSASKAVTAAPTLGRVSLDSGTTPYLKNHLLCWKKVSGASGYEIYRKDQGKSQLIKRITQATTLKWKDDQIEVGKEYTYQIRAYRTVNGKRVYGSFSKEHKRTAYGWRYVNGYKLYYDKNGKIVQDVRKLVGKQSSYVIKVNKKQNIVTVYAKDGNRGYIIPVKAFICSTGKSTITGTYYTPVKYRWRALFGNSWGQWSTRIHGSFLFHSVCYKKANDKYSLNVTEYNKLGTTASMGCIRLTAEDAKWIYDHCALKTKVVIYSSSAKEPLEKPKAEKLPSWHTWDPTDPTVKNKCKEKGCHQ